MTVSVFVFIQVPVDHIGIVLEQLGDGLSCNETENRDRFVAARLLSLWTFDFPREGKSEGTVG